MSMFYPTRRGRTDDMGKRLRSELACRDYET